MTEIQTIPEGQIPGQDEPPSEEQIAHEVALRRPIRYCEDGCCEVVAPFHDGDNSYRVCADCGQDEGHEHGKPCEFGCSPLSEQAIQARLDTEVRSEMDHRAWEMREHAVRAIEQDQQDHRTQRYFMRHDRRTVVKTEAEFKALQKKGVSMGVVSYKQAIALLKAEKAQSAKAKKTRTKAKAVRQARKKNRGR